MSSSIFGAEQRIGEPLSALAVLTGRHRGKNTRDPILVNSQRVNSQRVNDMAYGLLKRNNTCKLLEIFVRAPLPKHCLS